MPLALALALALARCASSLSRRTLRTRPPHPGAAEGLSFLSAVAGLAVLGFQLSEYGYLPEAVPIEGGVCSNI